MEGKKEKKCGSGVGADRLMGVIGCPSDVILRHLARAQIESRVSSLRQCPEQSRVAFVSFSITILTAIALYVVMRCFINPDVWVRFKDFTWVFPGLSYYLAS